MYKNNNPNYVTRFEILIDDEVSIEFESIYKCLQLANAST